MKGAVFIALNDMIENDYGMDVWNELLDEVKPESKGIYTSAKDYPDEEIVSFVLAISKKLSLPTQDVTRLFGFELFKELNSKFSIFTEQKDDLFSFLDSIEKVIHVEVRKLFENPSLPTLDCTQLSESEMEISYHSPRKLCFLAEGLIQGAAEHYDEKITLAHETCMHDGAENCIIKVTIV